jgi:predicted secreted protein
MVTRVGTGGTFQIELDANPTTGYVWEPEAPSGIELVDRVLEPGRAIGAAGRERFTFRAARAGDFALTLHLRRPWEQKAIETRQFRIVVR